MLSCVGEHAFLAYTRVPERASPVAAKQQVSVVGIKPSAFAERCGRQIPHPAGPRGALRRFHHYLFYKKSPSRSISVSVLKPLAVNTLSISQEGGVPIPFA